jgi:hypothetical protein
MNLNVITAADAEVVADTVKKTPTSATDIARKGKTKKSGQVPQVSEDDLYARLLKYIPAPLIGLYLMATNTIIGAASGTAEKVLCWIALAGFSVLIVVFLLNRAVRRKRQIAVSVVAFLAWAAASPGPFQLIDGWNEWMGTLALIAAVAVFIAVNIKPLPKEVLEESVSG